MVAPKNTRDAGEEAVAADAAADHLADAEDPTPEETAAPSADPADPADDGDVVDRAADAADRDAPADATTPAGGDGYLADLQRVQAEFSNYKRRMVREQTEHVERAAGALVEKLLPVLDAGDLALHHGGGEDVAQIVGALHDVLAKEGLEEVVAEPGTPFDPTHHDAVMHEDGDGAEPIVSEVLRAGYVWKGRLVRPSMVKVKG